MKRQLSLVFTLIGMLPIPASLHADEAFFRPQIIEDDEYTETYRFSMDMNDDGFGQFEIGITNLGPGSGRAVCRVVLQFKKLKTQWKFQDVASSGDWGYETDPKAMLRLPACKITEGEKAVLHAKTDFGELTIKLDAALRAIPLPKNEWRKGDRFFALRLLGRNLPATYRIETDSGSPLTGTAHLLIEHTRANISPSKLGEKWYRFRSTDQSGNLVGILWQAKDTGYAEGWVIGNSAKRLPSKTVTASSGGEHNALELDGPNDMGFRFMKTGDALEYAPLEDMGFLGSILGALVGDPLFTFTAVEWRDGKTNRRGILEKSEFR